MSTKKQNASHKLRDIPTKQEGLVGGHFRMLGYLDYVAARTLLRNGLAIQGLILASTCIEKYLKAVLATAGKATATHLDSDGFVEILRDNDRDVLSYISEGFLRYLGRAYAFRYIEPHSGPDSIAVEQRKLLAELDYSVGQLESAVTIRVNDTIQKSSYALAVESRDGHVWNDNHILEGTPKSDFVEVHCPLYCMAIRPMHDPIELRHENFKSVNNASFDFPKTTYGGNTVTIDFGEPVMGDRFDPPIGTVLPCA
jgi:hypothetical protein